MQEPQRYLAWPARLDIGFRLQVVGLLMHGGFDTCMVHHASCIMHARLFSVGFRCDNERNPDVVLVKPLRRS